MQRKNVLDLFMFSPKTTWQRLVVSLAAILVLNLSSVAAEPLRYNRDIRPLLSDKCFFCHGPDPNHREADLRLDLEDAAHRWGDRGGKGGGERIRGVGSPVMIRKNRCRRPTRGRHCRPNRFERSGSGSTREPSTKTTGRLSHRPVRKCRGRNVTDWVRNPIDAFVLSAA